MLDPKPGQPERNIEIEELEVNKETLQVLSEDEAHGVQGGFVGPSDSPNNTCAIRPDGRCHGSVGCTIKAGETDFCGAGGLRNRI